MNNLQLDFNNLIDEGSRHDGDSVRSGASRLSKATGPETQATSLRDDEWQIDSHNVIDLSSKKKGSYVDFLAEEGDSLNSGGSTSSEESLKSSQAKPTPPERQPEQSLSRLQDYFSRSSESSRQSARSMRQVGRQTSVQDIRTEASERARSKLLFELLCDSMLLGLIFYILQVGMAVKKVHDLNTTPMSPKMTPPPKHPNTQLSATVQIYNELSAFALGQVQSLFQKLFVQEAECGVPLRFWLQGFFFLFALRSFCHLLKLQLGKASMTIDLCRFALLDGFLVGWIVYGNKLYFSHDNTCGQTEKPLHMLMQLILSIGNLFVVVYVLVLALLPYNYYRYGTLGLLSTEEPPSFDDQHDQALKRKQAKKEKLARILTSLSRVQFHCGGFNHESRCLICLTEYEESDMVTALECNPSKHYFHTSCLESNVRMGNFRCPLCREEIQIKPTSEPAAEQEERRSLLEVHEEPLRGRFRAAVDLETME